MLLTLDSRLWHADIALFRNCVAKLRKNFRIGKSLFNNIYKNRGGVPNYVRQRMIIQDCMFLAGMCSFVPLI